MMLCKICCSPRFVACFCGDFLKQIEIGQSQKVAKNWMNCMLATEFWREQSMMQSLIHGEIPWHVHVTFFACEYFCTSKWVPLFHLFSRNINVKKHKHNQWKSQTITTYDIFPIFFNHFNFWSFYILAAQYML